MVGRWLVGGILVSVHGGVSASKPQNRSSVREQGPR